jgi:hypothetical protein
MSTIYTEDIRIRNKSSDLLEAGLTLWLLPGGGSAPGDLIELTEDAGTSGQYNFPVGVTNGTYELYSGAAGSQVPVQNNGETIIVRIIRDGIIKAEDTDFAY